MATLNNKKIKDTFKGLLKTLDNAEITGQVEITDGVGNGTGITVSNDGSLIAGDLQLNNTLTVEGTATLRGDVICEDVIDMSSNQITNLADPTAAQDAATKNYVDTHVTSQDLDFTGNTGTGDVDLDSETFDITGVNGITTIASNNTLQIDGSEFQSDIEDLDIRVSDNETKLNGIESGAEVNPTASETKTAYESNANTNAFTDAEKTKLSGIETGAEVNVVTSVNTETGAVVLDADDIDDTSTTHKFTTASDISKLSGIESGAQVNTVDSVNTQTGAVVLDADDIDDASTTNKWATAAEKTKLGYISVTQAVDLDSIEQKQNSQFKAIGLATDFGFRVLSDSGKVEGTQCIMENMEILILN